jgi:hypothetical protein
MIEAAFFKPLPDDSTSGAILWITQGQMEGLMASARPWVAVPPELFGIEISETHHVVAGQVVEKESSS